MSAEEQKLAVFKHLKEEYDNTVVEQMSQLYNQFTTFIVAAQIPLPHVVTVLALLQQEALEQAAQAYKGK